MRRLFCSSILLARPRSPAKNALKKVRVRARSGDGKPSTRAEKCRKAKQKSDEKIVAIQRAIGKTLGQFRWIAYYATPQLLLKRRSLCASAMNGCRRRPRRGAISPCDNSKPIKNALRLSLCRSVAQWLRVVRIKNANFNGSQ